MQINEQYPPLERRARKGSGPRAAIGDSGTAAGNRQVVEEPEVPVPIKRLLMEDMMTMHSKIFVSLVLAGLASAQVYAADSATTSTGTNTGPSAISMTDHCAGGGTRSVVGSYDPTTGALSTTTTLTACVARNGDKFDGTTASTGTLLAIATGFTINITAIVHTTVTRADGSTVARACTTTKVGTFTTAAQTFDGTTTETACSVTGKVLEHEGLVEHLLRPATGGEDGGAEDSTQRTMPPQAGEDSVREIPHMTQPPMGTPTTTEMH